MYVNIDVSDLDYVDVDEVVELFDSLCTKDQELFLKKIGKEENAIKKIKNLFFLLNSDEAKELLNELNQTIKSDKEWQEITKSINGDSK